uniref:von Willebrand factor type A domain-containing protein n=1 Tax=Candidatus Kentrum sp. SD TaxID=2126332 RepID=A0A450YBH8_9GAMM|nr:MAG: von Willebrand factor type A domain-containing protein [Candidatus Kentron sp. SD]VFK43192.1 MAG: von Willebrand factor type A domain-containing protein [Candidatus Kentron sp. SD]
MMTIRPLRSTTLFRLLGLLLLLAPILGHAADGYNDLFVRMQARQARLESYMYGPNNCLGERFDGLLEINGNCGSDARTLANLENQDRRALYLLMSKDLRKALEDIGRERAIKNQDRYRAGVQREIQLADNRVTWWDGYPPDPRQNDVSRILTLSNARIHRKPDSASSVARDNLRQYESFGVIGTEQDANGETWFEITGEYVPKNKPPSWSPALLGWIARSDVIPWRRALAVQFAPMINRKPSVFFEQESSLLDMIDAPSAERSRRLREIRDRLESGQSPGSGAIALEPSLNTNQEDLILHPVLDFYGSSTGQKVRIDGRPVRLLKVAAPTRSGASRGLRGNTAVDILFVMDTTHSMKPYLAQVVEATKTFARQSGRADIRFGFIAYQDKDTRFDYQVKSFTDRVQLIDRFVDTLARVEARRKPVRGDDIPESVLDGLNLAVGSNQWRSGSVRIIFLVGDAPGREDSIKLDSLHRKTHGQVGIYAFHIANSKVSKSWDEEASRQYKALSLTYQGGYGMGISQTHQVEIDANAKAFGKTLTASFNEALEAVLNRDSDYSNAAPGSLTELIFSQAAVLLADPSIPENNIEGWVADKVLADPARYAMAPIILLTEGELHELIDRVKELKTLGEKALRGEGGTTLDFFDLVERNTRFTMVDPRGATFQDAFQLPLGIDELPYDSVIMATTRDEFENPDRVQDFIRKMESKLNLYENLREETRNQNRWKLLYAGASERVLPLELDHLP